MNRQLPTLEVRILLASKPYPLHRIRILALVVLIRAKATYKAMSGVIIETMSSASNR
jgi:hypothetical protein